MKKTAVDYLFEKLWQAPKDKFVWHSILEKAKEMEEGQIAVAYSTGTLDCVSQNFTNGYSYYEKTYKTK
jgi:DNA polymerase IIIc chi subunit